MSFKICGVGCGDMATIGHGPSFQKYAKENPEVILAACCDLDAGKAEIYRNTFGFEKYYIDLDEMLFEAFLENEKTPVESDAADFLSKICDNYSPEKPLYVVAIGALTNVASAILKNASFKENCVVVWLGGNALHMPNGANEYNLVNDIAAARVVFGCGIPFVQVPCIGVADRFLTTEFELKHWLGNKNALCDYLIENTVGFSEMYSKGKPWSRVIWDVTAVAWLLNGDKKFMLDKLIKSPIPEYNKQYAIDEQRHEIKCVYQINRDKLFEDLFNVLGR